MADAVALGHWSGTGVSLGEVTAALTDLRHECHGEATMTRAAVMTLVIIAASDAEAESALGAVRSLGGHHPARILLLRPEPDRAASMDAKASLYKIELEGHETSFEEITLVIGGQGARHLDSFAEVFTLADLPIVVWFTSVLPDPGDAILSLPASVVVDTREAGIVTSYRGVLELARRRPVVDLSWVRLEPWRHLAAGLFDPPGSRHFLSNVTSAVIQGKPGPRKLLGGWLAHQLDLRPRQVILQDARHVDITLTTEGTEGREATFYVGRMSDERCLVAEASDAQGCWQHQARSLPDDSVPYALSVALTHLQPDPVWEQALAASTYLND